MRHGEIRRLALAVRAGRQALAANRAQLQTIVDDMAPGLTERRGVGAVTAAQVIVSFSPRRPLPKRRRVRRAVRDQPVAGQQRQDRAAPAQPRRRPRVEPRDPHHRHDPHAVLRHDQDLRRRRTAEGKTSREIRRCLKRYIARELYRALNTSTALTAATPPLAAA